MLKREQAYEALKEFRTSDRWLDLHQTAISQLPETLREIAWALLGRNANGQIVNWDLRELISQVVNRLAQVSDRARSQIFTALFPRIASYVELGWQLHQRLPYQSYGKPFRTRSEASTEARIQWVQAILSITQEYEQDIEWYAVWGAHIWPQDVLGILLAAAIEVGDSLSDRVFDTLLTCARGEHEIGAMGKHVTRSLLVASRPEGWTFIENLLLAAQRQEGLRQAILETIDEAHPEAFRRMVKLILEHDLLRFSATLRATDKWFGFGWDIEQKKVAERSLRQVLACLEDPGRRDSAIHSEDPQQVYLALWAIAFEDAMAAIAPATELLKHQQVEIRFAAAFLLNQIQLNPARQALLTALEDSDLRVATQAFYSISNDTGIGMANTDLFERLEAFLLRIPHKTKQLPPIVWEWMTLTLHRERITAALSMRLGDRSPKRLIPYLAEMDIWRRIEAIELLAKEKPWDEQMQQILFDAVSDRSSYARDRTIDLLKQHSLSPNFVMRLESLLTRKGSDLRRGMLNLLLKQEDESAIVTAKRLLHSSNATQRSAGLELLDEMIRAKRLPDNCYQLVEAYRTQRLKRTDAEEELLLKFAEPAKQETPTLENGLGLFDPAHRTSAIPPEFPDREVILVTDAARNILRSLDDLVHEYRATPVTLRNWDGSEGEAQLLGNLNWLGTPLRYRSLTNTLDYLPLAEVWRTWCEHRSAELRDPDGLELLRAKVAFAADGDGYSFRAHYFGFSGERVLPWIKTLAQRLIVDIDDLKYPMLVRSLLEWLIFLHPPTTEIDFILDAAQFSLAAIREAVCQRLVESNLDSELPEIEPLTEDSNDLAHQLNALGLPADMLGQLTSMGIDSAMLSQAMQIGAISRGLPATQSDDTFDWREDSQLNAWISLAIDYYLSNTSAWTQAQVSRLWHLLRWRDRPHGTVPHWVVVENGGYGSYQMLPIRNQTEGSLKRCRPNLEQVLKAFTMGIATEADVLDCLIGSRFGNNFSELSALTQRDRDRTLHDYAFLQHHEYDFLYELVDRCRNRILEIESDRGDLPTPATEAALSLQSVIGIPSVLRLMQNLGKEQFTRGWNYDRASKSSVFSHLIRISFPAPTDTPEDFAQQMRARGMDDRSAIELAVYAPQWARYVEHALNWPAFAEAVWWFHAHTKDSHWEVEQSIRESWTAQMTEYTPLTSQDLLDGAVDVAWFWRVYRAMQPVQWDAIHEAAKFASGGQGHQRARLFADAMLGQIQKTDAIERIQSKRHQDSVRALGLIPLTKGKKREADILERYEVIQEFLRGSKQFGSQRQASEKLAARIAMENLSRTAGYADPQRLEWAMEAKAVADLAKGAVTIVEGEVSISLSLDDRGIPNLTITKKGKAQKTIPAALKKKPEIAALQERKQKLTQQATRMRQSLEQAMCRGDRFTGAELRQLLIHPILRPMLQKLVFISETAIGYPASGGAALQKYDGTTMELGEATTVQIAHPTDLAVTAEWHLWQQECFERERSQPFKQIFRELYLPITTEQTEHKGSRRYAGHQVNPRQAKALFGQRGWVTGGGYDYDTEIHRTFYDEDISVAVATQSGWSTPAEVEGLTIDEVCFSRRSRDRVLNLDDVPPRVFSEVMRDLDLVVSVAHQGGVDPEASASTVEMRSVLIRETNRLLKLTNVNLQNNYALIEGELGSYSVHLGSGVVHRQPGGALCIIPIHSQHRGRLFLPFADDDPKTAEVISKILLLAKDREIQDPTILQQIL